MRMDITVMAVELGKGIWFILPAYLANLSACLLGGGRPLDFGKKLSDGRRLLGDGVTVRGFAAGVGVGTVVGALQGLVAGSFVYHVEEGFVLGLGAMLGDAAGSFVKRRMGIERGAPAPVLDQLDFFAGAVVMHYAVFGWLPPARIVLALAGVTLILHWLTNAVGYLLRLKEVPW